jgi:hypothetical protein
MKKLIVFGVFVLSNSSVFAQCDEYQSTMADVKSYADNAYSYAKKAYFSDNLEDVKYYAKKAMNSASDAMSSASNAQSYASDCGCDNGCKIHPNCTTYSTRNCTT